MDGGGTLVSTRVSEFFDAVVCFQQRTDTESQRICARVVPNAGFVQRYGAKAAVAVMSYLRPFDDSNCVVVLTFQLFAQPRRLYADLPLENLHLYGFFSAVAGADPTSLREMEDDLGVPAALFKRVGAASLRAVVRLIAAGSGMRPTDVIGLEADPPEALVRYYESLGFTPSQDTMRRRHTSWTPMTATLAELLLERV